MNDQQADIIIVGAGMVGSAAALSLARQGYKITLIEASEIPQWSEDEYGLRVSAISAASERLLMDIGAWQKIAERRVSPYESMHVWDASGTASLDFNAADSGQACLGYIVENNLINTCLLEQINGMPNVKLINGARLSGMTWLDDCVEVKLDSGNEIRATLIIAADGGNSQVRAHCGIDSSRHDYQQTGIVTRVRTGFASLDLELFTKPSEIWLFVR